MAILSDACVNWAYPKSGAPLPTAPLIPMTAPAPSAPPMRRRGCENTLARIQTDSRRGQGDRTVQRRLGQRKLRRVPSARPGRSLRNRIRGATDAQDTAKVEALVARQPWQMRKRRPGDNGIAIRRKLGNSSRSRGKLWRREKRRHHPPAFRGWCGACCPEDQARTRREDACARISATMSLATSVVVLPLLRLSARMRRMRSAMPASRSRR